MATKRSIHRDLSIVTEMVNHGSLALHQAILLESEIRSGKFTFDGIREEIIKKMALTAHGMWWLDDQEERLHNRGKRPPWAGGAVDPYLPKRAPASAKKWAEKVVDNIEVLTGVKIGGLYWLAEHAEGKHREEPTVENFGYCLSMMANGTGISWWDNHPYFEPLRGVRFTSEYYP